MASGEEAARPSVLPSTSSSSSCSQVGLEALFPAACSELSDSPELVRIRRRLQRWLAPHERAVLCAQRLLVWERPVHSAVAALALNTAFWLLSSTSLRPIFFMAVLLFIFTLLDSWRDKLPQITAQPAEATGAERESMSVHPRLLSVSELSHHLAESYLTCSLYVQEMLQYKRQNPAKVMKKPKSQTPVSVDVKTTALAMAITDSELSDEEASILESGGFSVSRATTPQLTDVSEDLDQQSIHSEPEESFSKDLPEFPSVEEFPSIEPGLFHFPLGSQEESQSPASLLIQHLASPLHFVNTHFNGHGQGRGGAASKPEASSRSLEALSEEIVSTAISTVVQNTLSALLSSSEEAEAPAVAEFLPTETPPCPTESPLEEGDRTGEDTTLVPPDYEDFELLDQSELEHMDEGFGFDTPVTATETQPSDQQHQS
ncbi:Reticulophagy regulator 2 [Bagarius yarrelli]|uniref:Reticulophagy regulator 2 n=1 Tax=Bagarius yarrelli TaxID=175774 RepID=A0A556VAD3_BAGYA|nr:Reticulophagy regulator 2 [Bagarius yarrelli]